MNKLTNMKTLIITMLLALTSVPTFSQDMMPPKDLRLAATVPIPQVNKPTDLTRFKKRQVTASWLYALGFLLCGLGLIADEEQQQGWFVAGGVSGMVAFIVDRSSYRVIEN